MYMCIHVVVMVDTYDSWARLQQGHYTSASCGTSLQPNYIRVHINYVALGPMFLACRRSKNRFMYMYATGVLQLYSPKSGVNPSLVCGSKRDDCH